MPALVTPKPKMSDNCIKPKLKDTAAMKSHTLIGLAAAAFTLGACAQIGLETPASAAKSETASKNAETARAPGYGAIAFSETSQTWRFRWNVLKQERANTLALDDCGDSGCRILLTFGPKQCGTFALGEKNTTAVAVGRTRNQAEQLARARCDAISRDCRTAPAQCNA